MTGHRYKVGDIVMLKSGGPEMTVQQPPISGRFYTCQWFAGKKLESGLFAEESLKKPDEKATSKPEELHKKEGKR